ncbi:MAG: ABC-F family ATP-binding cassette domain-containing protein [Myxococcaceae bacterium]
MPNIQVIGVTKAFGGKKLFEDVNVSFSEGKRYGLTGPNGAGKSTFMKIMAGFLEPDSGQVSRPKKTSVLKQEQTGFEEVRVLDVVIQGNAGLWSAMKEKDAILAKPDITEEDGNKLADLETVIAEEDGYSADSNAASLLSGLGVTEEFHEKVMKEVPAGLRVRVLLSQALFGKPEALLLDEPTNNLDLDSIRWLERFLTSYEGVLITISHDRHFLNEVVTHIADIDYEAIILYPGGYDDMIIAKSQTRSRVEDENAEKKKKILQLQDFIARFSAGTRSSQVQSRKKAMEKLQLSDLKRSNIERPFIKFEQKRASGKQTLELENISKQYESGVIVENFRALVTKGEKVAIIGTTGTGKTTLLKMLMGETKPDSGKITWGHEASIGYLPQDAKSIIEKGTTAFDWLHNFDPRAGNEDVRGLRGRMLFRGEEGLKPTHALSGGEAVRLVFSKLMLMKDNVLVLDDPTNHLDLESIVALGDALQKYEGTAFVVTHDRDLINTFATRIWAFTKNGLIDFQGSYEDYLAKHGDDIAGRGSFKK